MQGIAFQVVSIAEACLGGLRGRSALLIGPEQQRQPYVTLLSRAGMKTVFQEEDYTHVPAILPHVQLVMNMPEVSELHTSPMLQAATIARGCIERRAPLLIFDLATQPSVEEIAGLLSSVCLYTPADLRDILTRSVPFSQIA